MIRWFLVDSVGKDVVSDVPSRRVCREYKKELEGPGRFQEWNSDLVYPLHIEREEWQFVRREIVR
ncbi:hypothetical protein D3C71_2001370 [compost metagenome]